MAALDAPPSHTGSAIDRLEHAIEETKAGRSTYPTGSVFVDADAPFAGKAVAMAARDETPLVIVYPDGTERIYFAESPLMRRVRVALDRVLSFTSRG